MKFLIVIFCLSIAIAHPTHASDKFPNLVNKFCIDCHNEETTEGELNLQLALNDSQTPEDLARTLQLIKKRVVANEMPPEDADSLEGKDNKSFISSIEKQLGELAMRLKDDPGRVAMARLTPYEYRNVIRDLSNGIVTSGGRLLPNEGGAGEGFANVGSAQVMTLPQYEKYVDAAEDALRHLRTYPTPANRNNKNLVWKRFARPAVDAPSAARKEIVDEIISWHVEQQQKWGSEHRNLLLQELGFVHAAYLEAAWHYAQRTKPKANLTDFSSISYEGKKFNLAPSAMKKWWEILNNRNQNSPHATWAAAWRKLVQQKNLSPEDVRKKCVAIVAGNDEIMVETEDYAPPYEISFHEAKEEVLEAAEKKGRWPFRIEIGDAKELFLVVTDAGDGNRGEYAVWRNGRFVFRDGSSKPWQDAVTILGARSGKKYPFGFDGEKSKVLGEDAVGAKPPGALKFTVPQNAIVFEVDLTLDENRTKLASIQAMVLKNRPKSSSYIRGRFVFGGKKRPVSAGAKLKKEQERALRKRNVSEANKTKIGLNAERNVFAKWDRSPLKAIGGPWPKQDADRLEPYFPYHYTVAEVLRNATEADLVKLQVLEDRLASLANHESEIKLRELATSIIRPFARNAWRRELSESELQQLLRLFVASRKQGLSFDSSVKSSLMLVLSSPHFIYKRLTEFSTGKSSTHKTMPLSSPALATRLSFFLWGSLPDEQLAELANRDKLRHPDVLVREAQRMLKDKRAQSLATDFAGQMWDFADFRQFDNPDPKRFPEFTPKLREAMTKEVETFLTDLFCNDRPITNTLDSDYSFANEGLAKHYGIDSNKLPQDTFERIGLPDTRGGLATMGLFLTKKSLPLRTSPVQRGVWVMENMLGRHLPNPPADVPSLSEDDKNKSGENIRKQLERHRAQASCASCHDKIDPLGISLENFDAIGRWRHTERDGTALATIAETHDGTKLNGSRGLKSYLVKHRTEFIDHFNRKLLGYALGRSVSIGDRELLSRMKKRLETNGYRFSVLVAEIVSSPQFMLKRSDDE